MAFTPEKRAALLKDIRHLALMAAVILTGRSVLADWYVVPTGSMKPTILEGDRVFVWKSAYQLRVPFSRIRLFGTGTPLRGDVVVVRNPDGGSVPFVKRLVGLPGDVVELRNETLYINGKAQPTDFLPEQKADDGETVLLGTEMLGPRPHPIRVLPDRPAFRTFGPDHGARGRSVPHGRQPRREPRRALLRDAPRCGPPRPRRGRDVELEPGVLQGAALVPPRAPVHHERQRRDDQLAALPVS